MDCIFCRMVAGEVPAEKIFEDEGAIAFHDRNAQAPTHFLVVPKQHVESLTDAVANEALLGHLLATAARLAAQQKLSDGYRVVVNTGSNGGQTVPHLHLHVLGGRPMNWPPG